LAEALEKKMREFEDVVRRVGHICRMLSDYLGQEFSGYASISGTVSSEQNKPGTF